MAVVGTESLQLLDASCHRDRQNVPNQRRSGGENPFVSRESLFSIEGKWQELTLPVVRAMLPIVG